MSQKQNKQQLRVPVEVRVLGIPFKVSYHKKVISGGVEVSGETVVVDRTIKISKHEAGCPETLFSTITHEILHAIIGVAGHDEILRKNEEPLVIALENGLRQLIRIHDDSPNIKWRKHTFTFTE